MFVFLHFGWGSWVVMWCLQRHWKMWCRVLSLCHRGGFRVHPSICWCGWEAGRPYGLDQKCTVDTGIHNTIQGLGKDKWVVYLVFLSPLGWVTLEFIANFLGGLILMPKNVFFSLEVSLCHRGASGTKSRSEIMNWPALNSSLTQQAAFFRMTQQVQMKFKRQKAFSAFENDLMEPILWENHGGLRSKATHYPCASLSHGGSIFAAVLMVFLVFAYWLVGNLSLIPWIQLFVHDTGVS